MLDKEDINIRLRNIGTNLQYYRKEKGLTQREVGEAIGMQSRLVSKIERGIIALKVSYLYLFAELYEVDVVDFFE